MKQGRTLEEVGRELERQRQARKDFVADTRSLEMVTDKNGTKLSLFFSFHILFPHNCLTVNNFSV